MYDKYFVLAGAICLGVALLQAWLLVGRFASDSGAIARAIPGKADLLRSHIDYLMMAQFLFVFYALYKYFALVPPAWLVAATCLGSFFNPFAFFLRALQPHYLSNAPRPFVAMITLSCVATTVGYGATAWLLASAAFAG